MSHGRAFISFEDFPIIVVQKSLQKLFSHNSLCPSLAWLHNLTVITAETWTVCVMGQWVEQWGNRWTSFTKLVPIEDADEWEGFQVFPGLVDRDSEYVRDDRVILWNVTLWCFRSGSAKTFGFAGFFYSSSLLLCGTVLSLHLLMPELVKKGFVYDKILIL